MIDRRRHTLVGTGVLFAAALALSVSVAAGRASAESAKPVPDDEVTTAPAGPIVGGQRIQPREDQVPATQERLANDPKLKELYEGVMRDSDPSTYRQNREPVAR